jgi:hypothetical protein
MTGGGLERFEGAAGADRQTQHSESFFVVGSDFRMVGMSQTIAKPQNAKVSDTDRPAKSRRRPNSLHCDQRDLFDPTERRNCARCGAPFDGERGRPGRPDLFCSDACRREQAQAQRRRWNRQRVGVAGYWGA